MTIQNILVAYNGTSSSHAALSYAAQLAKDGTAHITALLAHAAPKDYAAESRWIPQQARDLIAQANAQTVEHIRAEYERQLGQLDLGERVTFQKIGGRVDDVLAQCARGNDLLILGDTHDPSVDEHVALHPDKIALRSGKPVVIVPKGYKMNAAHDHAVVAWDGKRSVARALSDALQLVKSDGRITLLTIGSAPQPRPINEIMLHLQRHGLKVDHANQPKLGSIGETILEFCRENNPSLLVMGAYEHSKFRVDFLGGATSIVLKSSPVPVLMSH